MSLLSCLDGVTEFEKTKEILKGKNLVINTHDDIGLYLVKYDKQKCDMNDPDVRKCRSLVFEIGTNNLVCVSPFKSDSLDTFSDIFKTHDKNDILYEEFVDGTMINLFKYKGVYYISTRSRLGAQCRWFSSKTFNVMFNECIGNYDLGKLAETDNDYNYSFVLQHPDNTIVKQYQKPNLVLVMVSKIINNRVEYFDNKIGKEKLSSFGIHVDVPNVYKFSELPEVYGYVDIMPESEQGIVLKHGNLRSKIRNQHYNYVRNLRGNTNKKQFLFFELRRQILVEEYLSYFPDDRELFDTYRLELYAVTNKLYNFYLDCFVRKNSDGSNKLKHKEIDFEYKPLVSDLHNMYLTEKIITTKNRVVRYFNSLDTAKILFVINYRKGTRQTKNIKNVDNANDNDNANANANANVDNANANANANANVDN